MAKIEDGKGRGFYSGVDSTGRLQTASATISEEILATVEGEAYAFGTATVSFTSSTNSAILYVKNNDSRPLILDRCRVMLGYATGGTPGTWFISFRRNPTAGTIISNALTSGLTNINHGSNITPDATYYRGVQGDTLTGGSGGSFPIATTVSQTTFPFGRVLQTGSSFGITLTPPTGTTAADVFIVLRAYYPQAELK